MHEVVSYEVSDGVAVVTIDRPDVRNAMNLDVFDQLGERAAQAAADDAVGAVVVTGAEGVFSSGLDVSIFSEIAAAGRGDDGTELDETSITRLQDAFTAFEELDKPTLAAVEGYCFGGGIQLAAACHVRAAAPSAQFSILEARWAIVPDLGGTVRIPRLVGPGRATELAMTTRRFGRDEAMSMGLVEVPLDGDDPLGEAVGWAARLAAGPAAVRRIPRLVRENGDRTRDEGLAAERAAQIACVTGPDFAEAVAAAMEGREPRFTGR